MLAVVQVNSARTLVLLMADNPSGRAIPTPRGFVALQMNAAQPDIDSIQGNVIRSPFENIASGFRERDVIQPAFARARYAN